MISDDEPITEAEADLLMRGPVADRIVDIIQNRPTKAPLVLALHGPWGSGKSSVLSLVRESFAETDTVCVDFEPWLFNDVEQLIRTFFATVYKALVEAGAPKKRLRKIAEKLGGFVTVTTKALGHEVDVSSLMERSPDELRKELREASSELGKRIVIVIDDVDRLPIDELALVLKLIRLCGSFPFFTYVLAYDRRVVSKLLAEKFKGDSDYLDKIVQVEVPLPPVPPKLIAAYIVNGLKELGAKLKVDIRPVVELFETADDELRVLLAPDTGKEDPGLLTRSLRDAKRFLNGLACTLPLVAAEVDIVDFVHLELIRIFFPSLYDELYDLRFSLATFDSQHRDTQRKERQTEHQAFAARVRQLPRGETALKIIAKVFPVFHASLYSQNQHYGRHEQWQKLMKASDPSHVEKYFQLRVPVDAIPRQVIRTSIDAVNMSSTDADAVVAFTEAVAKCYEQGRLAAFLEGIHFETDRISAARIPSLIEAIGRFATKLAEKPMPEREMSTAVIAVLNLLRRLPLNESNARSTTLIRECNPSFVLQLTLYCEAAQRSPPTFQVVHAAFVARLNGLLVQPLADLFSIYEYEWLEVLRVWGDRDAASQHVGNLLRRNPSRWVTFAAAVLEREGNQTQLRISRLHQLISVAALVPAAREADLSSIGAGRGLAERFTAELSLVPELIEEVNAIVACGRALGDMSAGSLPSFDWSVPVWGRARSRLEQVHAGQPWWGRLVALYEVFLSARPDVEGLEVSSPEAAVAAISTTDKLRRIGREIVEHGGEVLPELRDAIGYQTALPIRSEMLTPEQS